MAKARSVKPRAGEPPRVEDAPPPPPPLVVEVAGRPVPKGAVAAFVVPGKSGKRARAVVVQGGSKARRSALGEWCSAIADAALEAVGAGAELEVARFVGVPVEVEIEFRLPRPKAHHVAGDTSRPLRADAPTFHTGTPDVDKLTRAALDALIGVAFDDDSRVARTTSTKIYAAPGREGARIRVAAIGATSHLVIVSSVGGIERGYRDGTELAEGMIVGRVEGAISAPALRHPDGTIEIGPHVASTGRTCEVDGCDKATPYTDWTRCEKHNASAPATIRAEPQLGETKAAADARRERVRRLIGGTTFEAESHAFARHARVTKCDGDHAAPTCGDPLCWHGPGTPETRALPDPPPAPGELGWVCKRCRRTLAMHVDARIVEGAPVCLACAPATVVGDVEVLTPDDFGGPIA